MNSSETTIRVAVVEDRAVDRERLVRILQSAPGFHLTTVCVYGQEAIEVIPPDCDVILMDIQMPGLSGIDCARVLKARYPKTEIMMLTVVEDYDRIFQALAAGATGYLLKTTPPPKLLEAIIELHQGGSPMSGQIARQIVLALKGTSQGTANKNEPEKDEALSPVEQTVLSYLAKGLLYKEVAEKMLITQSTVRTHIWHIYRKLQAHNRTEAIMKGLPRKHS